MNDDLQSYIEPELEARIVALVLGEASAFEAEEMERLMEEMPELRSYREGVGKVHGLVGEAHREQEDEEWRLSDERRGNLFSKIEEKKRGYEALIEKQREKRISRQGLIYLCAACLMIMLVMLMLMQLGKDRGMKTEMTFVDKESPADTLARLDEAILGQSDFVQENRKDLTVGTQELSNNQTKANYKASRARLGEMKLARVKVLGKEEPEKLRSARVNFETLVSEKSDSTFSLNVSDVSFKLAKAALAKGNWPDASKVRPEEFVNALDYDDTKPSQSEKVACAIEQGAHPFMQQRNLMRIAMSTASLGRNASTPLRLTILLDQSGSMERSDRAESVKRAFALLASQLNANDEVTLVGFARTPRLLAERVKGNEAMKLAKIVENPLTEGGTNLEAALSSGLQLAKQQFIEGAQNRIILLTDGAANLGDALPENLARQVQMMRKHKIAFDTCGVGADGLNDEVLTSLAKQGDGRYYFLDRPEDADDGFAKRIAGALRPAAKNVKVQILFNPERVSKFKLYGFEKHKLKKEDFRNDSVDAAEMAEEESGVALYHFEPIADGRGDIGTVSVRFLDAATNEMVERTWAISYQPEAPLFSQAEPALRLASVAGLFAEKLKGSPVGERVDLKRLRQETELLKPNFDLQPRFHEFKIMLRQAGD
jgi:hypothetical protein